MAGLSRAESARLRALGRRKNRDEEGRFVAEGIRVVEELLRAGIGIDMAVISPALEETARGRQLAERLEGPALRRAGRGELGELADTRTSQGVLVVAETPSPTLDSVVPGPRSVALVLDGVQDPGNLGTLVRSAAAFGVAMLACLPGTVDPWNPKAVRASAGALFRLPVVRPDADALEAWLGEREFLTLGADAAGVPVSDVNRPGRVTLVVGNEGAGLGEAMRRRCDRLVAVPMPGGTESLNVAVAAGILLYELTRE